MIDRSARDKYAELLRHFAAGRVVNFDYEKACDEFLKSSDSAIGEIYDAMEWTYGLQRTEVASRQWVKDNYSPSVVTEKYWVPTLEEIVDRLKDRTFDYE